MGAWGAGSFENDEASDWVYVLEEADGFDVVRRALAVADEDYLEAPDATIALAAAEVVAAALGQPAADLPDEVQPFVAQHGSSATTEDATLALAALARVRGEDSELAELWEESGGDDWNQAVDELRARLEAAAPG